MKYAQFEELCYREWRDGFADVTELAMPGPEIAELAGDVFAGAAGDGPVVFRDVDGSETVPPAGDFGVGLDTMVNPVTRSVVKVAVDPHAEPCTARITCKTADGTARRTVSLA